MPTQGRCTVDRFVSLDGVSSELFRHQLLMIFLKRKPDFHSSFSSLLIPTIIIAA